MAAALAWLIRKDFDATLLEMLRHKLRPRRQV